MKLLIATGFFSSNNERLRRALDESDRLLVDDSRLGRELYVLNSVSRKLPCTVFAECGIRYEWSSDKLCKEVEGWQGETMLDALKNAAKSAVSKGHAVTIAHTGYVVFTLENVRTVSVD